MAQGFTQGLSHPRRSPTNSGGTAVLSSQLFRRHTAPRPRPPAALPTPRHRHRRRHHVSRAVIPRRKLISSSCTCVRAFACMCRAHGRVCSKRLRGRERGVYDRSGPAPKALHASVLYTSYIALGCRVPNSQRVFHLSTPSPPPFTSPRPSRRHRQTPISPSTAAGHRMSTKLNRKCWLRRCVFPVLGQIKTPPPGTAV